MNLSLNHNNIKNIVEYKRIKENILVVDWWLGNVCNYKCSYCFKGANDGDKRVPNLDSYENNLDYFLNKIEESNLKAYYIISGGEPTVYPHLDLILKKIKSHKSYNKHLLVTNGSRTLSWWERNKNLLDEVAISFHIENANLKHILEVCKIIKKSDVTLTIMMNNTRFDDCVNAHNFFIKNNILEYANLNVKALSTPDSINLMSYTNDQNLFIKSNYYYMCNSKKEQQSNVHVNLETVIGVDKENNIYKVVTNQLAHIDPNFTDWECKIGTEHISITFDGEIRANCREKIFDKEYNLYKGDLESENFNFLNKPVKCTVGRCRCLGLYNISKKLPSNVS